MAQQKLSERTLGKSGIKTSAIGLGCMSLSGIYGTSDDNESISLIHAALDNGITMLDSSDMYGWGHNEELLGKAIKGRRNEVVLVTKFGNLGGKNGKYADGRPEWVQEACELSLKRLGTDVIDLYYQHRIDTSVPTEDTVGAMARLIEQGKVRALGLSEAKPETIRRAHKVHPIAAVQNEYSLLFREEAEATLPTLRELGISLVAYSPLGRGLLAAQLPDASAMPADDAHRRHPRFAGDNLAHNIALVKKIEAIAAEKQCTPGQLVLAWLLAQGDDIVPIPGTKRKDRMLENIGALSVKLGEADIKRISDAIPAGAAAGTRYPEPQMASLFL